MNKSALLFATILALVSFRARQAAAEIDIAENHGWTLTTDGRINTFFSFSKGNGQPEGAPLWEGIEDRPTARPPGSDNPGDIQNTRIRSGFIMSVLGFNLKKQLTSNVTVTGRVGMWLLASATRSKADNPPADMREVYVKIDAPWGSVLAGRNLSLFGRGGILLDNDIEHGYGLGHPCSVRTVSGGACGHAGYGLLFPGFNPAIVYSTPEVMGLQVSGGVYDPSIITTYQYEGTPYPRFEGELTFKAPRYFHAFVDGYWQRLRKVTTVDGVNVDQIVDARGISAGAGVTFGPVAVGLTGHTGQGMGLYTALEDHPIVADAQGVLRKFSGFLGLASLTLGDTRIAGGGGVTKVQKTQFDPPGPVADNVLLKQQTGYSAGIYQTINKTVIVALEYFRAHFEWYDLMKETGPTTPTQTVNFINAGVTLIW
jgi:hypothetical protein